jgi:hypothetical protein
MLRKIIAIAWKDAIIRFSSRTELLFFLVLPIVFTLILGGADGLVDDSAVALPIVNEDGSELAGELIASLENSEALEVSVVDREEAEALFADEAASGGHFHHCLVHTAILFAATGCAATGGGKESDKKDYQPTSCQGVSLQSLRRRIPCTLPKGRGYSSARLGVCQTL